MPSLSSTDHETKQRLRQLFASAIEDASRAMRIWTHGLITLSMDEVTEMPLEEVTANLDCGDEPQTMVVLSLDGDVGGNMILTFDEENGRQLAASLLSQPINEAPEWSELEQSALQETGNILGCAYMNALTRLLDVDLVPSPPYFIQDYGACVLQQALMAQAMSSDQVMICRTRFHRENTDLNWNVYFIPSTAMRQAIEQACCQ